MAHSRPFCHLNHWEGQKKVSIEVPIKARAKHRSRVRWRNGRMLTQYSSQFTFFPRFFPVSLQAGHKKRGLRKKFTLYSSINLCFCIGFNKPPNLYFPANSVVTFHRSVWWSMENEGQSSPPSALFHSLCVIVESHCLESCLFVIFE